MESQGSQFSGLHNNRHAGSRQRTGVQASVFTVVFYLFTVHQGTSDAQSARPAFLPLPGIAAASPMDSEQQQQQQQSNDYAAASQSRTMLTQVEVPIPEPVADAPAESQERSADIVFDDKQKGTPAKASAAPAGPDAGKLLAAKSYDALEPIAVGARDNKLATAIGWSLYKDNEIVKAGEWFERAIQWDQENYEAAYGLALTYFRRRDYAKAEELARWRKTEYPGMDKLLGDILAARAVKSYQKKDYSNSRMSLDDIKKFRPLTRNEQIVQAWNHYNAGDVSKAADEFERLYKQKADRFTASGVYVTCAKLNNWDRIKALAADGGPLVPFYNDHLSKKFYQRGLFLNAKALESNTSDPSQDNSKGPALERLKGLENLDAPSVMAGGQIRSKSGEAGLSRLKETSGRAQGSVIFGEVNRLTVNAGITSLDSGSLRADAAIGKAPAIGPRTYNFKPKTDFDSLVDVRIRYEHEGDITPTVEVGISPAGGEIAPTVVGSAGLKGVHEWGGWSADAYRNSVKESVLSYTGLKDPYSGSKWGRVSETGVKLSALALLENDWNISGQASIGELAGVNVEDNTHIRLSVNLGKDLKRPDFAYLTIGPSITYEHFEKNQSEFTFGNGGYFSPSNLFQVMIGSQFMTAQGREYLIKGGVSAGYQAYSRESAPVFPLSPDGSISSGNNAQTIIGLVDVTGIVQLGSRWAAGGRLSVHKTADYSEFAAGVFLTCFFEPRTGLFASDLPEF